MEKLYLQSFARAIASFVDTKLFKMGYENYDLCLEEVTEGANQAIWMHLIPEVPGYNTLHTYNLNLEYKKYKQNANKKCMEEIAETIAKRISADIDIAENKELTMSSEPENKEKETFVGNPDISSESTNSGSYSEPLHDGSDNYDCDEYEDDNCYDNYDCDEYEDDNCYDYDWDDDDFDPFAQERKIAKRIFCIAIPAIFIASLLRRK